MKHEKNWLEWLVFVVSAALVALVLAALVYDAATDKSHPPDLTIELGPAAARTDGYAIPVSIRNDGDVTAEHVTIEVSAGAEQGQVQFLYVPRHSRRQGWVEFSSPADHPHVRVLGYSQP